MGPGALLVDALARMALRPPRSRMRSEIAHDGRRQTVEGAGEVRFSDDDLDVTWVEPGGRLTIEEERPGEPARRVEYRPGDGGVARRFWRDGREASLDAADHAWLREALLRPIRESGWNAPGRVARIHAAGGTQAVLDEIAQVSGDGARRALYDALLAIPTLSPDDRTRVLLDGARRIASGMEKHEALMALLDLPSLDPDDLAAAVDAAAGIIAGGDRAEVLAGVLAHPSATRETVVRALRAACGIAAGGDRLEVLAAIPPAHLGDASVRAAIDDVLRSVASESDRERAMAWLARSAG
jgi:hypothetical protein